MLLLLLLCLLAVLCLACVAGAWVWLFSDSEVGGSQQGTAPVSGGTLHLFGGEPLTLDPALVQYISSADYVVEIFSGLVALDSELHLVPDLASRWEISADGRTYTFHLREEARFHDGRPVSAEDVKYSLERACSPRTASPVAAVYLGDIVGSQAVLRGGADEIVGLEVVDDRTLRVRIDAPKAYFLAKLTYSTGFVVDRYQVDQQDWWRQPNGTGPFRLAEYSSERIVLERSETYYRERPQLERVVFLLSGGAPVNMYENGELDVAHVGLHDVERVRDPSNPLSGDLSLVPQLDVYYLGMDITQPPFDDARVRRAFNMAVDREKLTEVVLGGMGYAAEGIVPPGMPGYSRVRPLLHYDPSEARRLIGESSYGDANRLPPVTLTIGGSSGELPRHVEALVAMYRDSLGVEVNVEQSEDVIAARPQIFALGWSADYPDPENFLDILFHSASELNRTGYSNPEVDRLLEAARVEMDAGRRLQLYYQAEETIVLEAPWVPLWHNVDYVLTKPYVKGSTVGASIYPWLAGARIEQQ